MSSLVAMEQELAKGLSDFSVREMSPIQVPRPLLQERAVEFNAIWGAVGRAYWGCPGSSESGVAVLNNDAFWVKAVLYIADNSGQWD